MKAALLGMMLSLATAAQAAPLPGEKMPAIELLTSEGKMARAWQPGRVTVISFCAFWCDTWKEQSRRLNASQQALKGLPVDWTMISVDGRWSGKAEDGNWSDIARKALLDKGSLWTHKLDVISVPYTLVVDGNGKILYATQGIAREKPLRTAVGVGLGTEAAQEGEVHLAFDDFPSSDRKMDDALLDVLRANGIKASFYGSRARQQNSEAIVARAKREGHSMNLAFDYGRKKLIDPFDFKAVGSNELLRRITGSLAPDKTLVLRAGVRDTLQILPRLIHNCEEIGLRFSQ